MNLFVIDKDPVQAARWNVDRHVIKMPTEVAQMLCTAFWNQDIAAPYKQTHRNHPCSVFVRASSSNFLWTVQHGMALCEEYNVRYGKTHASGAIINWCRENMNLLKFNSTQLTDFAVAIKEDAICRTKAEFNTASTVEKYRMFYRYDKAHLHAWKANRPSWI